MAKVFVRLVILALLLASALRTNAQSSADESSIRAAMLLNIARFIDWPSWKMNSEHPQFVICILGSDPIDEYAEPLLQHQTVASKPAIVKHLNAGESASACHVLYASVADRKLLAKMQPELAKAAVLSVSERSMAVSSDQIVGLPVVEEHVHIEINLGLAQRSGLQISSRLLRLATVSH